MKNLFFPLVLSATVIFAQQSPGTSVSFAIDPGASPRLIPEYFFGVGRETLDINMPKEAPGLLQERIQLLKELKIKILRGPSGTEANYFLWKKGYLFTSGASDYSNYYDPTKETAEHFAKGPGFRSFVLKDIYAEAIALNVPYIFNVNVISQTPDDIADLVKAIRKLTVQPIFLEMGNELYEPYSSKAFPLCKDYIDKVREIKKAVDAIDPTVKFGVVCPAFPFAKTRLISSGLRSQANQGNDGIDRYLDWPQVLAANQDIFDAVILHPYIFFEPENATQDSIMAYLFAWNAADEDVLCSYYAKLFPSKKFWVTEFNVLDWDQFREKDPTLKNRIQMMKSPGTAIANMETLLRFIDAGNVELATMHTFADGQGFGVIQHWRTGYVKLPNYYILEALGSLINKFPVYYRLLSKNNEKTNVLMSYNHVTHGPEKALVDFDHFGAWGFGDDKGLERVLFINRTMSPGKVELTGKKLRGLWSYGGREAIPEFLSYSRNWTAPPAVNSEPDQTIGPMMAQIELPPYSVTIAEVINADSKP